MREEVRNWSKQAQADLPGARNSREAGDYYMSVFASHQVLEKALKALSLFGLREYPKGHSIIHFAQRVGAPESMVSGIRDLNPEYMSTRSKYRISQARGDHLADSDHDIVLVSPDFQGIFFSQRSASSAKP